MRVGGWREGEGRDPSIFLEAQDKHLWRPGSHLVISGGNISLVLRSRAGALHQPVAAKPAASRTRAVRRGEERHGT